MVRRGHAIAIADVQRFEQEIGARLPEDYRRFLLEINGGRPAPTHRTFTMRRSDRIGAPIESTVDTLHSLDNPSGEGFDLRERQLFRRGDYPDNSLRIGYDDPGRALVLILSGSHRGELWMLTLDDPPIEPSPGVGWFERRDVWHVANSFAEFMAGLGPLEDEDNA